MNQSLKAAYRECTRLTRSRAKNFYYAFLSLPRRKRRAIYAVYAFCRQADDIADSAGEIPAKRFALEKLRVRLQQAATGVSQCAADLALADAITRFTIEPCDLAHVIDGVELDLTVSRYADFEELSHYCHLVASAVGLAVLPILCDGHKGRVITQQDRDLATTLGIGMQLVNIVRDIREDIARDRIYLPREDLERFDVTEDDLRKAEASKTLRKLVAFESVRARKFLREGEGLLTRLPRRSRGCPALLTTLYSRILDQIRQHDYDVLTVRVSLSTWEKVCLMLRTWVKALLR